ncbi:response regulator transcription factor [Neptuniibacter sp. CAU 1671]|uniref:response regulator n=1 Tax=Neptuniibacter sp. CAU 1671 TaxID=3032593 RepID=UPI0023DBA053|nr:response regulator transcription factor [Neptuniibacter sp. CAU 1671]MDF2181033.1 response regulator transcription factor [Neptuniibacter sp. CAU 1671]
MKVLLVEDDPLLGQGIVDALKYHKYIVEWAQTGKSALQQMTSTVFDVAVLDIGLPDMSGLEVLQQWRRQGVAIPVLILTALDSSQDKVSGLDSGADDYMAKPFDVPEMMARLRALVRRSQGIQSPLIQHGRLEIDPAAYAARIGDDTLKLSRLEFDLLLHLVTHPNRVFTREALVEQLYSWSDEIGSNTVEVYIHHLRKKLGKDSIRTVRGVGYQIGEIE